MTDKYIKLNEVAKLHIQEDSRGFIDICRIEIQGMPMQSREMFGGISPSSTDIRHGLMCYGFSVCEWADNISEEAQKEILKQGIFPESWFIANILTPYFPEEIGNE